MKQKVSHPSSQKQKRDSATQEFKKWSAPKATKQFRSELPDPLNITLSAPMKLSFFSQTSAPLAQQVHDFIHKPNPCSLTQNKVLSMIIMATWSNSYKCRMLVATAALTMAGYMEVTRPDFQEALIDATTEKKEEKSFKWW